MTSNILLSFWNRINLCGFTQKPILLLILGLLLGTPHTYAQECPDFGTKKIVVENDTQNYFDPQLQVLGENIYLSGYLGYYDDNYNFVGSYQIRKVEKTGGVGTVLSNVTVSPQAVGEYCDTNIGTKVLSNGNFFIYWYTGSSGCVIKDAYYKILSPSGQEIKGTQTLNTNSEGNRLVRNVEIEQLSNGTIAAVYSTGGSNYALRRFKEDGTPIDTKELSITQLAGLGGISQYTHKIVSNKKGQFLIFINYYSTKYKVLIFNEEAGTPFFSKDIQAGPANLVHVDKRPFAKALPDGKFLLAYQVQNGSETKTRAPAFQILNSDGTTFKAEQRLTEYYSWGGIKEPILVNDGFILEYWYNDFGRYGPALGYIPYLTKYDFSGNKITDLNPNCGPELISILTGYVYFTDFDGGLGLILNDLPYASASSYDFSLIRRSFGPALFIDTVAVQTNTSAKVLANLGDPGDLVVSEKGLIYIDSVSSSEPLLEITGVQKVIHGSIASGNYEETLSSLSPEKVYAVRAYAKTSDDQVFYSKTNFFSTNSTPSFDHTLTDGILTVSVQENTKAVLDILVTDPDPGQTLSFTLQGADAALFEIDQTTKKLSFKIAPDFEDPKDQNKDNSYSLTLQATDNGASAKSTILQVVIDLSNVAEAPSMGSMSVSDVGITGAKFSAQITADGGGGSIQQSGFVYSVLETNPNPERSGSGVIDITASATSGSFSHLENSLVANTNYVVRAYAKNSSGIAYTSAIQFTTGDAATSGPIISYADIPEQKLNVEISTISPQILGSIIPEGVFRKSETIAGNGSSGNADGTGAAARFNRPFGMAVDQQGNVYIADRDNHIIRKMTSSGVVTTVAGAAGQANFVDGTGSAARFRNPIDVVIDSQGKFLYIADRSNHRIRRMDLSTFAVTTIAGNGTAAFRDNLVDGFQASFNEPSALALDAAGNLIVADRLNHRLRKVSQTPATSGIALHFDGVNDFVEMGSESTFDFSKSMTVESWIKVSSFTKSWQTIVAKGDNSWRLSREQFGNKVEFAVTTPGGTRVVTGSSNVNDGKWHHIAATFDGSSIKIYVDGVLENTTTFSSTTISNSDYNVSIGQNLQQTSRNWHGAIDEVRLWNVARTLEEIQQGIKGIVSNNESGLVAFYDFDAGTSEGTNTTITKLANKTSTSGLDGDLKNFNLSGSTSNWVSGKVFGSWMVENIAGNGNTGLVDGAATTTARLNQPTGVAVASDGTIYFASAEEDRIRKLSGGVVAPFVGGGSFGNDGLGALAQLNDPYFLKFDQAGNLYVADATSRRIRKITPTGEVSSFAGAPASVSGNEDGIAYNSRLSAPVGLAFDQDGNLYVSEFDAHRIRKISLSGYEFTGSVPNGISFDPAKGEFSGTPTHLSLESYYMSDFEEGMEYEGKDGLVSPSLTNNAALAGSLILLTPLSNGQKGGMTIPASGRKDRELQVDFDLITGKTSGGADGISYNFAADADASSSSPAEEIGTGSGLSLSFNTYVGGIRLYYGAGKAQTNTVGQSGLLAYSNSTSWRGKSVQVSLSIIRDSVTVYVDKVLLFDKIPLPADYTTADLSTWKHVFKSRTGGFNDIHALDRVSISQGYGTSTLNVRANNSKGSYQTRVDLRVGTLAELTTLPASNITYNSAKSGLIRNFDGNFTILRQGLIWGTDPALDLDNALGNTEVNVNSDSISYTITSLDQNTTYYVRAFAENSAGLGYGKVKTFKTRLAPPDISYVSSVILPINQQITDELIPNNTGGLIPDNYSGVVSTLAGSSTGFADGQAAAAQFSSPYGAAVDAAGNVFVADSGNRRIRKITPDGLVSTLAGSTPGFADGQGASAKFSSPNGIAVDALGNVIVADAGNHRIRKITPDGLVSTLAGSTQGFADGQASAAKFNGPNGVAVDAEGNVIVADFANHRIRKITPDGTVSTLAGSTQGFADGQGTAAKFYSPSGVAVDAEGNVLVADYNNNRIRKITPDGTVSTLAGGSPGLADGEGVAAKFKQPLAVAVDYEGNVWVADFGNYRIRKITADGLVSTLPAGIFGFADGGIATARFNVPGGVALDTTGDIVVADTGNNRIRKISNTGWSISPSLPAGLVLNKDGSISGTPTEISPETVYTVTATNLAGTDTFTFSLGVQDVGLSLITLSVGNLNSEFKSEKLSYQVSVESAVSELNFTPTELFEGSTIQWRVGEGSFTSITSGSSSPSIPLQEGENVLTVEVSKGNLTKSYVIRIRKAITPPQISYVPSLTLPLGEEMNVLQAVNSGGSVPSQFQNMVTTLAGSSQGFADEKGASAQFSSPFGVAVDVAGNVLVADLGNHRIRKITPDGIVSTLAGSTPGFANGKGAAAQFYNPTGIEVGKDGNVFVADGTNNRIRKITPDGLVSTLAGFTNGGFVDGKATAALFNNPYDVAIDAADNVLLTDFANHRIRKITPDGVVSTLAGSTRGFSDGLAANAQFNGPYGIAVDALDNVLVVDAGNHRIRKITPDGMVSTLAGSTHGFAEGQGASAQFNRPYGIAVDAAGNVFVADLGNNRIRKISPDGMVSTVAGSTRGFADGLGTSAQLIPHGVTVDVEGNILVADLGNHKIRKISTHGWSVSPSLPAGLVLTEDGSISGMPTAISAARDYVITATNGGGTSAYTVRIEVTAGATEGLRNLVLSYGTLSPAFNSATFTYEVQLESSVDEISFIPTVVNTDAQLSLNGSTITSAVTTGTYNLNFGPNTFKFLVKESGGKEITYTVVVTRALGKSQDEILWEGTNSKKWTAGGNWRGNSLPASGADVKFSPTATNDLEVDNDLIAGTIDFNGSDKKVVLVDKSLTVSGFANRSASNLVEVTGAGRLKINIGSNVKALYPVANQSYTPVSITNKTGQAMEFNVGLSMEVVDQGTTGTAIPNARIKRTWDIGNPSSSVGGSGIDLEFSWTAAEDTGVKNPALYHYENGAWVKLDLAKTTVDLNNKTLVYKGYTGSLSPFAIYDELPTEIQLTISAPSLTKTKIYDGTTIAAITAGTLAGVAIGDDVTVSAEAVYDNAQAGSSKTINVTYTIGGADASKYLKPVDEQYTDGEITKIQLTASPATITTSKIYDGNTQAAVTPATLSGVLSGESVKLLANAIYDNADAGTSKTITVSYTLDGTTALNYLAPSDEIITTGAISPASLTVTVNDDAKFIGQDDDPEYSGVTFTGFVLGDSPSKLTGSLQIVRTNSSTNNAGDYPGVLIGSGFISSNYDITYVPGNFTIVPADALMVKLITNSLEYGESGGVYTLDRAGYYSSNLEELVDLTESTSINGNLVSVSDGSEVTRFEVSIASNDSDKSGAGLLKVGNYLLEGNLLTLSTNVNSLKVVGSQQVTPKPVDLEAINGTSKIYDGTRDMIDIELRILGMETGDEVNASAAESLFAGANVGTQSYTVEDFTLSGADAVNYKLSQNIYKGIDGEIFAKALTVSGTVVTLSKAYDGTTTAEISTEGTLEGAISQDAVSLKASAHYLDKNVGVNKRIKVSYILDGEKAVNYLAPTEVELNTGTIIKKSLSVTDPTIVLRKAYDGTRNASVEAGSLLGLVSGDNVGVKASALYSDASVGTGKTITVSYSLSGSDTLNYQTTLQEFVTQEGEIYADGPIQLLITEPTLTLSKDYDGTASASVTAGSLIGQAQGADVQAVAAAVYETEDAGTGIKITVSYTLTGTDSVDYVAPPDYVVTKGEIKKIQLNITEPTLALIKDFDGTASATVQALGTVTGVLGSENVKVNATAAYENSTIGKNKKITVTYTLDGTDKGNYLAPVAFEVSTGEIREVIEDLDGDGIPDADDPDSDGDGIENITEQQVPDATGTGMGDGNGDGIADYLQAHVVSFKSAEPGIRNAEQFVTLATPVGDYKFSEVVSDKKPAGLARSVSSRLPFGVTKFTLDGLQSGEVINLSVFVGKTTALTGYFKQANGQTAWTNLTQGGISTQENKKSLTFSISDNGVYDLDATAGVLKDPGLITAFPMISSNGGEEEAEISIKENQLIVTTVEASDDESSTFTYGIEMGADELLFEIDAATGELSFKAAPDFENPADANKDNVYELIVNAFASNGTIDRQQLFIAIEDDNDTPSFMTPEGGIAYLRGLIEFEDDATASSTDENPGDDMLGAGFNGELTLDLYSLFEDQDKGEGNTLTGIAISENDADAATEGVWEYSTDLDAQVWYPIGAVSKENALLLDLESFIRFVAAPNFFGTPKGLKVHPVDGSGATVAPEINSAGGTAWTFDTEKKYYSDLDEDAINSSVGVNAIEVNIIVEGTEDLPEAKEVAIIGLATVESQLTGTYTFADLDGDSESGSVLAWFRSESGEEGTWEEIDEETADSYMLTLEDLDQYVRFGVRPNDGKGFGEWAYSDLVGPIKPNGLVQLTITDPLINSEKVYDGTSVLDVSPGVLLGILRGDEVSVQATASLDNPAVGEGKSIEVSYTLSGKDADKYKAPEVFTTASGKVTHASLTITTESKQKTFGESDPSFTVLYSGFVNGESEEALSGTLGFNREPGESVGIYEITPSGLTSDNYQIAYNKGELTIISKSLKVSGMSVEDIAAVNYSGQAQTPSVVVKDGSVPLTQEVDYTLSYSDNTDAGKGTVTITGKGNYSGSVTAQFAILPLDLLITPDAGLKKSYGATDPEFTYTQSGAVAGEIPGFTGSLSRVSGESVGEYDISLGALSLTDNGAFKVANYRIKLESGGKLMIEKAKLVVKVNSDSKFVTLPDAVGYAGVSYTGFAFGEDKSVLDETSLMITRTNSAEETAGTYAGVLVASGLQDDNYEFEYTNGDYTILAADRLLVKLKETNVVYGDTPSYVVESAEYLSSTGNQVVDLTSTTKVTGTRILVTDGSSGSAEFDISVANSVLSTAGKLEVGSYELSTSNLNITSPNFNNTMMLQGVIKVNPMQLSVSLTSSENKEYDGNEQLSGLQLSLDAPLEGDVVAVSGKGTYASKNAGDQAYQVKGIVLSGGDAKNYFISGGADASIQGSGKITPKELTLTPDDGQEKVFGQSDPVLTFTSSENVLGEDPMFSGSLERAEGEQTGTYPINIGTLAMIDEGTFLSQNYTLKFTTGKLFTITKAKVTITADNKQKVYGEENPTLTFSYKGLVNGDTKVATEPSINTTATASSIVGTYPITLKGGSDVNYDIELKDGTLTVGKAKVTITADDKQKTYGEANPALTFTYSGLVNGDAKVATEPSVSTTATASSNVGTYPITLEGGSDDNYEIMLEAGSLTIGKKWLTITADDKQKTYGEANPTLTFTYTGLVNGDTKVSTEPSIATTATSSSNVGTYPITLEGGSDDNYAITLEAGTLTIGKKALTITADDKQKTYGEANPTLTFTYTGLVNGDTKVTTEPSISTTATASSNVGTYPITLEGGSDDNYAITLKTGTLTIGQKALTITADDKQKTYGEANPTLTFTYSGLVSGDTKVATEPSISTTATASSNVGTYPITLSGGEDQNYAITLEEGTLTIGKKGLTITADDKQKTFGEANPTLTFTYTGLVNGDTKVTTEPSINTTATAASSVGTYPIELAGGADQNYAITLVNGTLTIGKKALTITADDKQKTYGEENPALTFTYTGLVNGDTKVAIEPTISTTATAASNVGTYPIELAGGSDDNYAITLEAGTLTIGQKALTITADDKQKTYGEANPELTFTYTGLVNGDAKVAIEPTISTTATASSNVGTYPIMLVGGSDDNYAITLEAGTLTIGQKALTITADDKQKTYGEANPTLTFTYTGLVNGDAKVATEPSISTTAAASSNVGTYPIGLAGGKDQNYEITLIDGELEIVPAVLQVKAVNQSKIFGQADPEFTYTVSGLVGTDEAEAVLSGALEREAGEVPGVYEIRQGTLRANANYVMAFAGANLLIEAARILSVTDLGVIETPWGQDPVLPAKVTVLTTDGQLFEVGLSWNTFGLDIFKRGVYTIRGAFNLPEGIVNPDGLGISVAIRVSPKPAPLDVTLTNSVFVGEETNFFIEVGAFQINDPVDNIHKVELFGPGYDNKYFEVKDNILFWSSADRAEGKTTFTIIVRVTDRDGNTLDKFFEISRIRQDINEIEVFNAFTPDGDGINDTWGVPEIRFYRGARVQVFERSGERVFYTEDPDVMWDGTYKGKELPVGTYFWVLELRETGETRRGMLNLIRK